MDDYYTYPWVIFTLKKERYAIPTPFVQTMVAMPTVTEIPNSPSFVRGAINLRDQVTPLIDLRDRLEMGSSLEDINSQIAMLKRREQDHLNWLAELENSVNENRDFKLATDPHKCKFGKWYDTYTPKSFEEGQFLKKFDIPHQKIHGIAIHVEELIHQDKQDEALKLIENTRHNELEEMIRLFAQFVEIIKKQASNEIAIVMEHETVRSAIAVDSIITVEKLSPESIEPMPEFEDNGENKLASYIAKSGKEDSLVCLLEAATIINEAHN